MESGLRKDEKKAGAESREEQKRWIRQRSQGGSKTKVEYIDLSWLLSLRNLGVITEKILLASFAAISSHHICRFLIWLLGSLHVWKAVQRNRKQKIPDRGANESLQ